VKLKMTVRKIVTTEFEIELNEWYSWDEMSEKEKHEQIASCLVEAGELLEDGVINENWKEEKTELKDWDLIK